MRKEAIRKAVWKRRGSNTSVYFDVLNHLENEDFVILKSMPLSALTYLSDKIIFIKERVYNEAAGGRSQARLVIAHELGHFDLHSGQRRVIELAAYEGIMEIEASFYAYELLAPIELVAKKVKTPSILNSLRVTSEFGVTREVMDYQYHTAVKEIATHGKSYHINNLQKRLQSIHLDRR